MRDILFFFNDLRLNSGAIWLENETIKLSTPQKLQNEETRNFIITNKTQIVSILKGNNVFSKETFLKIIIFKDTISGSYPLSPAQERLWFIEQYEQGSNAYHLPVVYELDAATDRTGIKYALQQIVSRHEVLRSTIEHDETERHGIQRVHDEPLLIEEVTLTDQEDLHSLLEEDINRPFDLSTENPLRVKFYTIPLEETATESQLNRTILLINFHHIASDAWSMEIFQRELFAYYEAFINNDAGFSLPPLEIQYKDYAIWQRTFLTGEVLEKQLDYWKNKLSGFQTLDLPTDYVRPGGIDYSGSGEGFVVDGETSKKLRSLAQRLGVSIYSVMLSSINILLSKYTGQEDIITGSAIANRHYRQTEDLIGFFVNTQANRTLLNSSQNFTDLIKQVHLDQAEAQLYQDLPFEKLVEELGVERDPSRHPVFQVMVGIQDIGIQDKTTDEQKNYLIPFQEEETYEVEKFDLSIFIYDGQEELMGHINYATALFHKHTIERFIQHYHYLLEQLTEAPEKPYSKHSLLSAEEYEKIVYDWNETDNDYPGEKTIYQLFQEQAEKTPDNIALVYEGQQLTYKQLNEKSNQLARHIREQYLQRTTQPLTPDTLIALGLERSAEMVIGILAILKAGGAYVPIDINYPQERIDYLLSDTRTELILTQRKLHEGFHTQLPPEKIIYIDLTEKLYEAEDSSNLPPHSKATDLAYVIYTSGTTGKPKGVMVEQRSISSLVFNDFIRLTENDVFAFLSSPVFDASTFEIWTPLLNGNTLIIPPDLKNQVSYINAFKEFITDNNISILWLTKTLFESLFHFDRSIFKDLNYLITGGEVLDKNIVDKLIISHTKPKHFLNGYGPTESTTFTSIYDLSNQIISSTVPIGTPIKNRNTYILYPDLNPVPIGIIGELYIGGAGVARGYLNRPDLTEERFIPNPFATEADKAKGYTRLYKTGDLVRWLPDGSLEYIGRNDDQVKIRGFRIELGEIENALSQVPGILQSCVLARERKTESGINKYLVGYYVSDNSDNTLSQTSITDKLSQVLPEYMVPGILVAMESFQLTINGKLDKRALPDPDFNSSEEQYVSPGTETEAAICGIWQVVLGLDLVGITDNFFRIGGNSILAIQVSYRMSRILGCDVKVSDVFKYKTISNLLLHNTGQTQTVITKGDMDRSSLSFAQERLWFIEQYEQGSNAYHIPLVFELEADDDIEGIKYALQKIVSRHEVLRSTIEQGDNEEHGIQRIHKEPLLIKELKTTKQDIKSLIDEDINRPFNLSAEYPLRVIFYTIQSTEESAPNRNVLLINFHHIASDGWSIGIFQKEWAAYYEAYCNNNSDFCLPALEIQYKDYAIWQRSYLSGEILEKQLSYWKNKLSGYQALEFPTDYSRPGEIDYRGSNLEFSLGKLTSQKLRALAKDYGVTLHCLLLSSINILLSKYTGQEDIVSGSVIANRHHRQTEGLIGFFVNTQVNRTQLNRLQNFADLVQQVHQEQVEAQLYQDLPFEKLVEELEIERDLSRHPIFQVMFGIESFGSQPEASDEQKSYHNKIQAEIKYDVEKFDLSITIDDSRQELMGQISYATALFHKHTIERFIRHYIYLLEQLSEDPEQPYSQYSLLSPQEYKEIVYDWNDTEKDYPKEKTICQLFQEQVEKTPDKIALVYEEQKLSYKELNEKSNQLARHIRQQYQQRTKQELVPDTLIVLYLERSLEMVIGILAVLKAGGTYVPIDITYPQERIDYLLEDTQAELILSQLKLSEGSNTQLPPDKVIYINLTGKFYKEEDHSNLPKHSEAGDLAYLIYTSGSTGKPKAVAIEHHSVVNMALSRVVEYNMTESENSLQIASICFDASVEQIFVALFSGATLTLIKKEVLIDGEKCELFLNENKITHLDSVPSFLETLDFSKLKYLKRIASGGESCTVELVNRILPYAEFYNEYGPTEATVITTQYKIEKGKEISEIIPIGKPIHNAKIFILDNYLNIVPANIVGEIYIGGECLARGYLNNDKLNVEKFVPNPFGAGRLYKTGDLGRWRNDGQIEYSGRKDNQVKIRGFRIELGEIEHALSQITGIRQCCILVKERKTETGSDKYLVAYYILNKSAETVTQAVILEKLSQLLPEYMLPGALVEMESFPLTINDKLDKRALPEPDFSNGNDYIKPNTELEIRICQIYAEVLGLASDQISTHQNFFRMGGNSILSIQLKVKLSRLNEFKHINVADLFKYNTINKLIQSIQKDVQTEYIHHKNITQNNIHDIAIIGISGAFSGAKNIAELWHLIANQLEGIQLYNKEQLKEYGIDDTLLEDPFFIPVEGKVEDIELFDPSFWEMSPNEAKQLDPQIRKFIEHCWFALESSGYAQDRNKLNIGVFAGSGGSNYFYDHILNGEMADQIDIWEASISNDKDALATKTAYLLDLTGPANSINTACSTGLVSVVEACKNLQLGTCNMALAGGVSLAKSNDFGYMYEEGMILSKDGHCRTFDKDASGTIGGSGVAVVLMKRLQDAVKDNDPVLGVIKGYATNNDGARKTGYTAPSLIGQSECIINAQAMAGIIPDQIDYVECHGTATHLGDPIEVQALREAFQYNQPKGNSLNHKTILGAVKANIGHTDSAAGTAGLIKVVAMLQHSIIPGQVNFNEPNPQMQLDKTSFEIIKENKAWPASQGRQRLAGVSSFGIGGTNAHVIVGDYSASAQYEERSPFSVNGKGTTLPYIIPLSAKSRTSLERYKQALIEHLINAGENNDTLILSDIAYTLEERRVHFNFRTAYCAMNIDDLIIKLSEDLFYAETNTENNNKVVFMFPGQGAQYTHMAKELYHTEPIFSKTIDQCITLANQHLSVDLFDVMYPKDESLQYDINEIQWTPITLFIIEYALAGYLKHLGIKADAYIGNSSGEYTAATIAGVFRLEDVIKVLIARGKLMYSMQTGSMLSVNAKEEVIKPIAIEHDCEISLINSPEDIVVSGSLKDIKTLQEALEKLAIPLVKLTSTVAAHSKSMDQAAHEFEKVFEGIKLNKPAKDFVSNVTGEIAGEEVTTAGYWSRQLRNTVQFAKGIDNLSRQYNHQISFIEVGTGKGLSYFVNKFKKIYRHKSIQTVQLLPTAKEANAANDDQSFKKIMSREGMKAWLWMNGLVSKANNPELSKQTKLQTGLPSYQFDFQKCWLEKSAPLEIKKFNSPDEILYERSWERANIKTSPVDIENLKHKNIIVLVNKTKTEQSQVGELMDLLNSHCDKVTCLMHEQADNFKPGSGFDFSNASQLETILNEKTGGNPIDFLIYISPSIDTKNPCLDIFAIRNIFNWLRDTGNQILKFISISFDNYEVTGHEMLQEKPSVVYGVTKSIPFEYFTSGTKAFHLDFSVRDSNYKDALLPALVQNEEKDLFVIRGKYQWLPTYRQVNILNSQIKATNGLQSGGLVFLITGGLGGVGYAYADYLTQKDEKCTLILLGRTKEINLREDYKTRLTALRNTRHCIIYKAIDIGLNEASSNLEKLLTSRNINTIEVILHSAGIPAKSALTEKTQYDIEQVMSPKITGVENLIKLGRSVRINNMVCCSSLTSIIPALGNMEYTAANLYLDEISNRIHPGIKYMLSINLNQISDTGMAVDFINKSTSGEGKSLDSIRSYEFPGIVEKLLKIKNVNNIALSRYDLNTEISENARLFDHLDDTKNDINVSAIKIIEDSYTEPEYQIAQIFGDALGIEQVSVHDDFFRLGGNSIHAIHVSHRISKALNCDVFVADLFKHKTISNIKDFLLIKINSNNIIGKEIEI